MPAVTPSRAAFVLLALCLALASAPLPALQFVRVDAPTGGMFSTGVGVGDFDGDGLPDVVSANYWSGDLTVFLNAGGAPVDVGLLPAGGPFGPWWVTAGDLNDDGLADIIAAQLGLSEALVYLNQGTPVPSFSGPVVHPVVQSPEFVHIDDIDEDGAADFLVTNDDPVLSVFLGDGSGQFSTFADIEVPLAHEGGHTVRTNDFDQDGLLDFLVSHSTDFQLGQTCEEGRPGVSVGFGDGTGAFPDVRVFGVEMGYHGIDGDFDNDGWPDIATADSCGPEVRVILNDGTGAFPDPPTIYFVGQTSHNDLNTADLNCDGNLDLLVADASSFTPQLHVLLGDGTGAFSPDPDGPHPAVGAPSSVRIADLDGDGDLDIATADIDSETVSMWLNQFQDTDPPVVTCSVETACLWPPNHKLVDVGLAVEVEDNCAGLTETPFDVTVTSDEPTNSQLGAGGKGNDRPPTPHAPDAVVEDGRLLLRAERAGLEDGRVYRITVSAEDAAGNVGTGTCEVHVPHDQAPKTPGQVPGNDPDGPCPAIDSGGTFDAFEVD